MLLFIASSQKASNCRLRLSRARFQGDGRLRHALDIMLHIRNIGREASLNQVRGHNSTGIETRLRPLIGVFKVTLPLLLVQSLHKQEV